MCDHNSAPSAHQYITTDKTTSAANILMSHNASSPWLALPTVALVAIARESPEGMVALASTCTTLRRAFGPESDVAECVLARLVGEDARGLLRALAEDPCDVIKRQAALYRRLMHVSHKALRTARGDTSSTSSTDFAWGP